MSDIIKRVWDKYLGVNSPEANLAKELATEIGSLRTQVKQESDCAEMYKAKADQLWRNLAETQAREAQLRGTIAAHKKACTSGDGWTMYYDEPLHEALTLPTDDTALKARLKAERERCAVEADLWGFGSDAATAIRNLGDE